MPSEVKTLVEAEKRAQPGDMILIAPGVYKEQLLVETPDITIRGEDRNTVVIDGEGTRSFGIVSVADGVRVENLTTQNAIYYGVLFTGLHDENGPSAPTVNGYEAWNPEEFPPLQRFLVDHVTAINNGLYGIYAFNAQHGAVVNSYASGSADSGLYIGQCRDCDILLEGNTAERSAVGYENANASDFVVVVGNRFTNNRLGVTLLSNYQEAFVPQARNTVVGNLIADNTEEATPAHVNGGFGIGIGISGGIENVIERGAILAPENGAIDSPHLFTSGEHFGEHRFEVGREGRLVASDPASLVSGPDQACEFDRVSRGVNNLLLGDGNECENVSLDEIETLLLKRAVERAGGNIAAAARLLGITRPQMVYRLKSRGIVHDGD